MSRKSQLILAGSVGLNLAALIFTLSRGAWLAFLITALFMGLAKSRTLLVLILALAASYNLWFPEDAVTRINDTFVEQAERRSTDLQDIVDPSAVVRIIQWKAFPSMVSKSFLLGTGLGSFQERIYTEHYLPSKKGAHSTIIRIGVEQGVVGLFLYGLILWTIYTRSIRAAKLARTDIERALGLGTAAATVCLFFLDYSGTRFLDFEVMTYYWILAGLVLNTKLEATKRLPVAAMSHATVASRESPGWITRRLRETTSLM